METKVEKKKGATAARASRAGRLGEARSVVFPQSFEQWRHCTVSFLRAPHSSILLVSARAPHSAIGVALTHTQQNSRYEQVTLCAALEDGGHQEERQAKVPKGCAVWVLAFLFLFFFFSLSLFPLNLPSHQLHRYLSRCLHIYPFLSHTFAPLPPLSNSKH